MHKVVMKRLTRGGISCCQEAACHRVRAEILAGFEVLQQPSRHALEVSYRALSFANILQEEAQTSGLRCCTAVRPEISFPDTPLNPCGAVCLTTVASDGCHVQLERPFERILASVQKIYTPWRT